MCPNNQLAGAMLSVAVFLSIRLPKHSHFDFFLSTELLVQRITIKNRLEIQLCSIMGGFSLPL